jgi:hypothetical protein
MGDLRLKINDFLIHMDNTMHVIRTFNSQINSDLRSSFMIILSQTGRDDDFQEKNRGPRNQQAFRGVELSRFDNLSHSLIFFGQILRL